MRATLMGLVLASAAFAAAAGAAPSRWDKARDPSLTRRAEALALAVRALSPRGIPPGVELSPEFDALLALRASTVLELAGGGALGGADVLFFLGGALVRADRGRDEEAVRLLRAALELEPRGSLSASAWLAVGIASARLGDSQAERGAYDEALALEWSETRRGRLYVNRGEAHMALGGLERAIRDFQTVLATTTDSELHAHATWGLAVAVARRGELPLALEHARKASQLLFPGPDGVLVTALDLPGVFFTPAHEIFYYRALAVMAEALHAGEREGRRAALSVALEHWARYIEAARATGDRYLENARHQELWCRRRLEAP